MYLYSMTHLNSYKNSLEIQDYNTFLKYGGESEYNFFMQLDGKTRADQHLKQLSYGNKENIFIRIMQEKSQINNHNLYIIIPPARKDYKDNIPDLNIIFENLLKISQATDLKIINFFYDDSFKNEHFGDTDHLNRNGALLLTNKIRELIY